MAVAASSSSTGTKHVSIREIKWDLKVGAKIDFVGFVASQRAPIEGDAENINYLWICKMLDSNIRSSNNEIELYIRGSDVVKNSIPNNCVLSVRNAFVDRVRGKKYLRCAWKCVTIDPPIPKAQQLKKTMANFRSSSQSSVGRSGDCEAIVFTPISEILERGIYQEQTNVIGLVVKLKEPERRETRAGKLSWVRVVFLADSESSVIEVAIWGAGVPNHNIPLYTVICATKATVLDSKTPKTLSCLSAEIRIDPDHPKTDELNALAVFFSNESQEAATFNVAGTPQFSQASCSPISINSFTRICDLKTKPADGSKYNMAGIVLSVQLIQEQRTKYSGQISERKVEVADDADSTITMSIWGPGVKTLNIPIKSLIIATRVTVHDYLGNKTLNCLAGDFKITSNFPEAKDIISRTTDWLNGKFNSKDTKTPSEYTKIKDLLEITELGKKHRVAGLVIDRHEPEKNVKDLWVRRIAITEDEDNDIELTIWGNQVRELDIPLYSVVTAQEVVVREFKGRKTLGCYLTQLQVNPKIPQLNELTKLSKVYSKRCQTGGTSKTFKHYNNTNADTYTSFESIISNMSTSQTYNIVGIIVAHEPITLIKREKKDLYLKMITVIDEKGTQMNIGVWGSKAMEQEIILHAVITAKGARLRIFREMLKLDCYWDAMSIEPLVEESDKLRELAMSHIVVSRLPFPLEFARISEINKKLKLGTQWDIIGWVHTVDKIQTVKRKGITNATAKVLKVRLKDSRRNYLWLSIWDNNGSLPNIAEGSIMAVKDAHTLMFEKKLTLNTYPNMLEINPKIPAVKSLKNFKKENDRYRKIPERAEIDEEYGDYTPFDVIIRGNAPTDPFNTIGLIVKVNAKSSAKKTAARRKVQSCVLRDKNGYEINLEIGSLENASFSIPLDSLITVRDATISRIKNLVLHCDYSNIVFNIDLYYNIDIPEIRGFKNAALRASPILEDPVAPIDYTAFNEIHWTTSLGKALKIIGTVVHIIERDDPDHDISLPSDTRTSRVTLRDKNLDLISLNIKRTPDINVPGFPILLNWVLSVEDAILRVFHGYPMLWCSWKNIRLNPAIPEKTELQITGESSHERNFMSFKVIKLAKQELLCNRFDVIGTVVKVVGLKDTFKMEIETEGQRDTGNNNESHYLEVELRNEIDLKLQIFGSLRNLVHLQTIILHNVIVVEDAKLTSATECTLETRCNFVHLNTIISPKSWGANSLRVLSFKEILKCRKGDAVGFMAIVSELSNGIYPLRTDPPFSEESEEDIQKSGLKYTFRQFRILDASRRKHMTMLIPMSIVDQFEETENEVCVVLATNMIYRDFDRQPAVEWTPMSTIIRNPKCPQAEALIKSIKGGN